MVENRILYGGNRLLIVYTTSGSSNYSCVMDQMREDLSRVLAANGFAEKVEALARMDIANAISEDNELRPVNKYLRNFSQLPDGMAIFALISEYLAEMHLDFTLDVFLAETGTNGQPTRPDVRAMMRLVEGLQPMDEFDTKIDKMVYFFRQEGDLLEHYPDLLSRLMHRLNIPEYNECVRGVGADPVLVQKAMHSSLLLRQTRDENERRRTQSMVCRERQAMIDDSEDLNYSFADVLNSTAAQADDGNCDVQDNQLLRSRSLDSSCAFGRDSILEGFRTLPGGVLDVMSIVESDPLSSSVHLNDEYMDELKDALDIDADVEIKVKALGPNIVLKQLQPRRVEVSILGVFR